MPNTPCPTDAERFDRLELQIAAMIGETVGHQAILTELQNSVSENLGRLRAVSGVDQRLISVALTQIDLGFLAAEKAIQGAVA